MIIRGEAAKYIPDEVKSLEGALSAMKDKLARGDYKDILTEAKSFTDKEKGLLDAAPRQPHC